MNPVRREYPRNYIRTGISAIDGLTTLIRGQKLPIFSGNGLPHDQLAAQIVKQASLSSGDDQRDSSPDSAGSADSADSQISSEYSDRRDNEQFAVVFAAMGVKHDVAEFFPPYF